MSSNIQIVQIYSSSFCIFDKAFDGKCLLLVFQHEKPEMFPFPIQEIATKAVSNYIHDMGFSSVQWSKVWDEIPRKYWKQVGLELTKMSWLKTDDPQKVPDLLKEEFKETWIINIPNLNIGAINTDSDAEKISNHRLTFFQKLLKML